MAVRRIAIRPREGFTDTGEYVRDDAVTRDDVIRGLMDAEALLHFAGGVVTVIVGREPTDVPGEMRTNGVLIEWKDRTDAKPAPEAAGQVVEPTPEPPVAEPPHPASPAEVAALERDDDDDDPEGDLLPDPDEEDLSSIPEHLRSSV
jgi:hypothetical protein